MSAEKGPVETTLPTHDVDLEARQQKLASEVQYAEENAPDTGVRPLHQKLKSRHMQMIAIGGSIGAGLFVGSGGALRRGGPAAVLIGFAITGIMLLMTMQALGELAVLYPVNGAFYSYIVRFVSPAWGFAVGWEYAIGWLTVLPFELIAASITIEFWRDDIHMAVWVTIFLVFLVVVNIFGVRGYGEVEFVLSIIKILACMGFIIFGIVVNTGGIPGDDRGYIGFRYWSDPGAFRNGFKGFCSVFVTAAFAFGGTELVGLAAAEAENPRKSLPTATKQVFWRIAFFYIVSLLIVGIILPSDSPDLMGASGANTKASPFVLAIKEAGVKGLPSVFNAVITISVISVANSCTYGSSRTLQALAATDMAPKFLQYIDKHGRPIWCVIIQLAFGLLAYLGATGASGDIFNWLLALSGLNFLFIWFFICVAHIRFRSGWSYAGFSKEQLPYQASFGVVGSYIGATLCALALIASFYTALYPVGGSPNVEGFFSSYLSGPLFLALWLFWMLWTRDFTMFVKAKDMDITSGVRRGSVEHPSGMEPKIPAWRRALGAFF